MDLGAEKDMGREGERDERRRDMVRERERGGGDEKESERRR